MATMPSPVPTAYSCHVEICKTDQTEQSSGGTHMSNRSDSSAASYHTYSRCDTRVTAPGDFPCFASRRAAMDKRADLISDNIEVVPVVVLSQTFPARPSSLPDIRDFVRRCLAQSPLSDEDNRAVGETVSQALLEAAGPSGAINVSFRIFPDHVEVDVLRSGAQIGTLAGLDALTSLLKSEAPAAEPGAAGRDGSAAGHDGAEEA